MESLHWADYLILVTMTVATIGIGLYQAFIKKHKKTTEEFIIGSRKIKVIPLAISKFVTGLSAVGILSDTTEMHTRGIMMFVFYKITFLLTTIIGAHVIIPWMYPLKLLSIFSYFRQRYRDFTLIAPITSILGVLSGMVWSGVALYAPSLAFETATGVSHYISIPIAMFICIVFTSLGGMHAVVWTDVFQGIVMLAGCLTILVKAVIEAGGLKESFSTYYDAGRVYVDFSPDPTVRHTFWGFVFGRTLGNLANSALSQNAMQRFTAASSMRDAQKIPYLTYVIYFLMDTVTCMIGVAVFAYYAKMKCDPLASGAIRNPNQILPYFVMEAFKGVPGFNGLFLTMLVCSSISTISSNLSGASANAYEDVYKSVRPLTSERHGRKIIQVLVAIFGIITIGIAFSVDLFDGPIMQIAMTLISLCRAPVLGIFALGGLKIFRKIHAQATLFGALCGFLFNAWIYIGGITVKGKHPRLPPVSVEGCTIPVNVTTTNHTVITGLNRFYTISYLWYPLISASMTVFTAIVISKLMDKRNKIVADEDVPEELFLEFPFSRRRNKKSAIATIEDSAGWTEMEDPKNNLNDMENMEVMAEEKENISLKL